MSQQKREAPILKTYISDKLQKCNDHVFRNSLPLIYKRDSSYKFQYFRNTERLQYSPEKKMVNYKLCGAVNKVRLQTSAQTWREVLNVHRHYIFFFNSVLL